MAAHRRLLAQIDRWLLQDTQNWWVWPQTPD